MSDTPSSDVHSVCVTDWEKKASHNLSLTQKVELFEMAIHAVEKRACVTLSGVTLLIILDRVIQQCKFKHPILSHITIVDQTLKLENHDKLNNKDLGTLIEALRFLLLELLRVFGRLTADILTIPLHNELDKVKWTELEKK